MCQFPYLKHKFFDVPDQIGFKEPLIIKGVYILFARPFGRVKLQYCERCGSLRLVSPDTLDVEAIEIKKSKTRNLIR
jgi:hypothetical protein